MTTMLRNALLETTITCTIDIQLEIFAFASSRVSRKALVVTPVNSTSCQQSKTLTVICHLHQRVS